jgi:hypothetical protein
MGLYYSGGYDWTFVPGPIREAADYQKVKPQSEAYGKYADAQIKESKDTPSSTKILWRKRSPRYLIRVCYPPLWAL